MADLLPPDMRTVDVGVVTGLLAIGAKFILDFFKDRAKENSDKVRSEQSMDVRRHLLDDNVAIRKRLHSMTDVMNRDMGALSNRIVRLEESDTHMGVRLARMEDKIDKLLDRLS